MTSRLRSFPRRPRLSRRLIAVITAAVAASAPSPAAAATTIGQTFATGTDCGASVYSQLQQSSDPTSYTVPSNGVITQWSHNASTTVASPVLKLKIYRSTAPPDGFLVVGQSTLEALSVGLNTFSTQIPVQAGDVLGYTRTAAGTVRCLSPTGTANDVARDAPGADTPTGMTTTFNPTNFTNTRLNISAVLEPDCDADGFGDDTQDSELTDPNCSQPPVPQPQPQPEPEPEPGPKADGTLTIDANKGKVEKGRKVTLTGQLDVPSNESCEQGRAIQIQRRLKSEDDSKFTTFETVNTDAAGNYTLDVKVKKTYFYRAVISETDACDDETSNSQKVRVQKKKAAQEA